MGRHYPHDLYEEIPILEAARRCGLVLNDRTLEWDEVEASCPFCGDRGPGKYHLSLNSRQAVQTDFFHDFILFVGFQGGPG